MGEGRTDVADGAVAGSRQKWSDMAVGRPLVPLWCAHRTVVQVVEPDLTEFESLQNVTARRSSARKRRETSAT